MAKKPPLISKVKTELSGWEAIKAQIDAPEVDPAALIDTLEGETDLFEALTALYAELQEKEAELAGLKVWLGNLGERKSRLERTIETARGVLLMAMDKAGIPSITSAIGTFGVAKRAPAVSISDETQIPSRFWVAQDPRLDKTAVAAAVKNGEDVPGASLDNGGIRFFSRVK